MKYITLLIVALALAACSSTRVEHQSDTVYYAETMSFLGVHRAASLNSPWDAERKAQRMCRHALRITQHPGGDEETCEVILSSWSVPRTPGGGI